MDWLSTCVNAVGSMNTIFFQAGPVNNYQDALRSNTEQYAAFFNAMLEQGIYLAPSQFEAAFISLAHTDDDLARTCEAIKTAITIIKE